jgi:hypothetical protein
MHFEHINFLAILVAALSTFLLGGLWYSPILFGKAWMRENHLTEQEVERFNKGRMFGWSFVLSLVMAGNLAAFLSDAKTDLLWGMLAGALAGAGWVAAASAIVGLFENKTWKYILINGGYQIVAFSVMGSILGAWR